MIRHFTASKYTRVGVVNVVYRGRVSTASKFRIQAYKITNENLSEKSEHRQPMEVQAFANCGRSVRLSILESPHI